MPTPEPKRRWLRLSPDRFVISLLFVIGLLWLSDRFQWFGFNHHKGWTVLIAVAAVGVAALVMLLWWSAGLLFHWRFQFGIRSMFVFCLACSIAVSWLAVEMRQARRQAETVGYIDSSDRLAVYDWEVDADNNLISNSEPPEPRWLRNILGDNYFSTVVAVNYISTNITDAGLEHLKGLAQLRELYLAHTMITDAGLEDLKGLTHIRKLNLADTKITDAGPKYLEGLAELQVLDITGTNITDAGLQHLKGLTQLRELYLDRTKFTDAGLECLKGLSQLQVLVITATNITDAGLVHLKDLTQLRELSLTGTTITGAGLECLKGLTQLRVLILDRTTITDAGLRDLTGLTQLQWLDVSNTNVSDADVEKLQQALPNCKIMH